MEPIQKIDIPNVVVPEINNPNQWIYNIPSYDPPVTLQLGFPIVDMPGCVNMHKDNKDHVTKMPFDHDLVNQDPKGSTVLCPHGEYPTYEAMDYQPEQLIITREVPPPPVEPPPTPEVDTPEVPPIPKTDKEIECPAPNQPRVGDLTQNGEERVIGHEVRDGQCVVLYEDTTAIQRFLPSTNQVSVTATIAVVATASAAATPLLLRVIKPVIKKLTTIIQKKLGKEPPKLSRNELQCNKYREKKGLPPFKRPKKKKN